MMISDVVRRVITVLQARVMFWTERMRKFEEEEQLKKMEQPTEQAAELNSDKLDEAMQLFDKRTGISARLPSHITARTVSSELLVFCF